MDNKTQDRDAKLKELQARQNNGEQLSDQEKSDLAKFEREAGQKPGQVHNSIVAGDNNPANKA